jgi:MFS family permease
MSALLLTVTLVVAASAGARGTWSPCGLSMVSAINPLAERGRGYRYWLTVLWFVLGAVLGGAVLGAAAALAAWLAGSLPASAAALLGCLGCLVAIASDCRVGGFRLPIHPRQVNEHWLNRYRRWVYATGFGFQIGTGFATYVMTAATYLVVLLAVLTGSPVRALAAGLVFGLVRGGAVLLSSRCRAPESLRALHQALARFEPVSRHVVLAVEGVSAVTLAAIIRPGLLAPLVAASAAALLVGAAQLLTLRPHRPGRSLAAGRSNQQLTSNAG